MGRFENGLKAILGASREKPEAKDAVTFSGGTITGSRGTEYLSQEQQTAMKLSAVNRCVEVLSDSIGKLPVTVKDSRTRKTVEDHALMQLLSIRPNEVQTPLVFLKMLEGNRLCGGNGYAYIVRDPRNMRPTALIPIPANTVCITMDLQSGTPRYSFPDPFTARGYTNVHPSDMIHVMGYTYDGYKGVSVLERAAEVIGTGRAAQQYSLSYYANGGQPAGLLHTDTDLTGTVTVTRDGKQITMTKKDVIRDEWQKLYSGPGNAGKVAVLDFGLEYKPIAINNRDAQFVEQTELTVQDIARFFGVPLYKLQAGKQSYSSNEQNAVEYVVGTLHPIIEQYEKEFTYKLLTLSEIRDGLRIEINLMAELRGDAASRGSWYRAMREIGVLSVNDILAEEGRPDVEGGDERYASLNYVPLADWKTLSKDRAAGNGGIDQ